MNTKTTAAGGVLGLFLLIIVVITLLLGMGGGVTSTTETRSGTWNPWNPNLNEEAIPDWARDPLRAAAGTCPEITGPILAAQVETESQWNRNAHNNKSGADGLSQFMPKTWAEFGTDGDGDGRAETRNPADAIKSQAVYMCHLVSFCKKTPGLKGELLDLSLASYNAGPGNVKKAGGVPPFTETINYIAKIRRLANTKYANVATVPDSAGQGRAGPVITKAAEQAANKTPYAWGGGTLDGPSGGQSPDVGVIGFDCSSLVRWAYYQGSKLQITLPRTSREQFAATRGQAVAVEDLQPGDLLFWGAAGRIHHVALYIGNGRMIEAPESGKVVHETAIRTKGDYAGAGRVFGGPLDKAGKAA